MPGDIPVTSFVRPVPNDGARVVPAPVAAASGTEKRPRRISVLGATGSIGRNTLDLIARAREQYHVVALTGQTNAALLAELAIAHDADIAAIGDERLLPDLKQRLSGTRTQAWGGTDAIVAAAAEQADCTMAAIVGAAGLKPTFAAAKDGRRILLANKECLVSAGSVFLKAIEAAGSELIPVDSEHSAAFQAIGQTDAAAIEKIELTASGGPFRELSLEALKSVSPEQALQHPNWSMGAKITIDSATLMNKGLELIEAYHLFPVDASQLGAVVHPQSIVHCLVSLTDGSVMAHMSHPDMRTPIAVGLAWPERMATPVPRLDLAQLGTLTFEPADETRFPCLRLAREALARGGGAPTVLNAANEVAVAAFLARSIGFLEIPQLVERCLDQLDGRGLLKDIHSLEDVLSVDREARVVAEQGIGA